MATDTLLTGLLACQPQSFRVLEVWLLIVQTPGFGRDVCMAAGAGRAAVPGGARVRTGSDCAGLVLLSCRWAVRAGQAGAGRAHRRCQQVRKAAVQGQSGLILKMRWRA